MSRRFHAKSRNGCGQCKRRRVKCDLQAPICSHCKRRNEECEYLQFSGSVEKSSFDTRSTPITPPQAAPIETSITVPPHFEGFSVSLETLLRQYIKRTSMTLSMIEGDDFSSSPWGSHFLPYVESLPFLRHIILSLSALHMSYLDSKGRDAKDVSVSPDGSPSSEGDIDPLAIKLPPSSHYSIAYSNEIIGSMAFRDTISSVNQDNWFAVLTFAIGVLVFRLDTCRRATSFTGAVTDLISALRTAGLAQKEIDPYIKESGLFWKFLRDRHLATATRIDADVLQAVEELKSVFDGRSTEMLGSFGEEDRGLCKEAMRLLSEWILLASGQPRTWAHYVKWPASMPDRFVDMMNEGHPAALVIFVHWCAVMARVPKRWFFDGLAQNSARMALKQMSSGAQAAWGRYLEWPVRELGIDARSSPPVDVGLLSTGETVMQF